jgi:hypothetical protein
VFDWSNTQNGKLIGSIGIVSAIMQGGYVRRSLSRVGELNMARRGTSSCAIGLLFLALVPHLTLSRPSVAFRLLQAAAVCIAFTSATVVNALTAHASLQCDEEPDFAAERGGERSVETTIARRPELAKGQALGRFRSSGQLGRAIGPLLGNRAYFFFGAVLTRGRSVCILLDLWTLFHIYSQCCCYDRSLSPHAKSRASNIFEDGLTVGHAGWFFCLTSQVPELMLYKGCCARPGRVASSIFIP